MCSGAPIADPVPRRLVSANFENASRIRAFRSVRVFGHNAITGCHASPEGPSFLRRTTRSFLRASRPKAWALTASLRRSSSESLRCLPRNPARNVACWFPATRVTRTDPVLCQNLNFWCLRCLLLAMCTYSFAKKSDYAPFSARRRS